LLRRGTPLLAALTRVFLWTIVALSVQGAGQRAIAEDRAVVLLLPIVIHSMDQQQYLRDGLSDMLFSRLAREKRIAAIRATDPATATIDLEKARAHAAQLGAQYVVFGSFTHFGEGASLDLTCAPVEGGQGSPRQVFVQSGTLGEIIPALDRLVDRMTVYVVEGEAPERDAATVAAGAHNNGGNPGSVSLQDLLRRVEALEQAVQTGEPVGATDDELQLPGVFDVYPDAEPGQNGEGLR
jgi:hypothetical protein